MWKTPDVKTALVLCFDRPAHRQAVETVQPFRQAHDRGFARWPPHITLLFPFTPEETFDEAAPQLANALRSADVKAFHLSLTAVSSFKHGKKSHTAWLRPTDDDQQLQRLYQVCAEVFPSFVSRPEFTPHLTVGQFQTLPEVEQAAVDLAPALARACQRLPVTEVCFLARTGEDGDPMEVKARVPLGASDQVSAAAAASSGPASDGGAAAELPNSGGLGSGSAPPPPPAGERTGPLAAICAEHVPPSASTVVLFLGASWCARSQRVEQQLLRGLPPAASADDSTAWLAAWVTLGEQTPPSSADSRWCVLAPDNDQLLQVLRDYQIDELPALVVVEASGAKILPPDASSVPTWLQEACATTAAARAPFDPPPSPPPPQQPSAAPVSPEVASAPGPSVAATLTSALEAHDRGAFDEAATLISRLLVQEPFHRDANYNLGVLLLSVGLPLLAVPVMTRAVLTAPDDRVASSVLGSVLGDLEPAAVARAYRRVVSTQPSNLRAAHMLATLTGEGEAVAGAAAEYVKEVFDELSATFEDKLVHHLGYRVPWQLLEAVDACAAADVEEGRRRLRSAPGVHRGWTVVDLGCGTGLCGRLFRKYVDAEAAPGRMVGVDLSPKMVDLARDKGGYDELLVEDVHATLERHAAASVDLVLSADTFIYVGDLKRCFDLAQAKLTPHGIFAFSVEDPAAAPSGTGGGGGGEVEDTPAGSFKLQRSGRYAHTAGYVERLAHEHAMTKRSQRRVVVRTEQTTPVPGWVFVLQAGAGTGLPDAAPAASVPLPCAIPEAQAAT